MDLPGGPLPVSNMNASCMYVNNEVNAIKDGVQVYLTFIVRPMNMENYPLTTGIYCIDVCRSNSNVGLIFTQALFPALPRNGWKSIYPPSERTARFL